MGILKLRNADIELRHGETDIGRKNTRVRLVFRVHIPESGGQLTSLQVCSQPIECCKGSLIRRRWIYNAVVTCLTCFPLYSAQRAQELPTVERQDLDRCSVLGGQQMVLTGLNFTSDSRVIFSERTQGKEEAFRRSLLKNAPFSLKMWNTEYFQPLTCVTGIYAL